MAGSYRTADATAPAYHSAAITPHDTNSFQVSRSLYIGTGGDLTVRMASGRIETYPNAAAGYHPLQVDMVFTSTTATGIIALY